METIENTNQQQQQQQQQQQGVNKEVLGENRDRNIEDRVEVVHRLVEESRVGEDFYFLLIVSSLITTLGILVESAAVVIGGMLIAPLLSPILALGLGVITTNKDSIKRSAFAISKSTGIVVFIAFLTTFLLGIDEPLVNLEVLQRIQPNLAYMYIAILSGIGATYTWAKPKLNARLSGIAIVVALMPPLCVVGIGMSELSREIITGSLQLYIVNLIGIIVSSAVVFSLLGFHDLKFVEKQELVKEEFEKEIKKRINQ